MIVVSIDPGLETWEEMIINIVKCFLLCGLSALLGIGGSLSFPSVLTRSHLGLGIPTLSLCLDRESPMKRDKRKRHRVKYITGLPLFSLGEVSILNYNKQ